MPPAVLWFRRDLRLEDHPALAAASHEAGKDGVVPLFVIDDRLHAVSGAPRLAFLHGCLRELDERTGGALLLRHGDPVTEVVSVAKHHGATAVHVSADFGPYGHARDERVAEALAQAGIELRRVGSPYAVDPGEVRKGDGTPFKVFTPFSKAWKARADDRPCLVGDVRWTGDLKGVAVPKDPALDGTEILPVGEAAAIDHLDRFLDASLTRYADRRNLPAVEGTSRLSTYLKYGCIHPRTILDRLHGHAGKGAETFRTEVCWREFYADVLWHNPETWWKPLNVSVGAMEQDEGKAADERFEAWADGRTGYPIVDAGMRQLKGEAWVHNRVRMIVASFLVKDLHLPWQRGARLFIQRLQDGDLASNHHGWQWVAGTGTDAAPYFRIFNPVSQGEKFDPDGEYVRRWVPELRALEGKAVHRPWEARKGDLFDVDLGDYPAPIVDHAEEREESLRRYKAARG